MMPPQSETPATVADVLWHSWFTGRGIRATMLALLNHGHDIGFEDVRQAFIRFCDRGITNG
jgi:hypothetical protein